MTEVEALLAQLRHAASTRGPQWLQSQVSGLLGGCWHGCCIARFLGALASEDEASKVPMPRGYPCVKCRQQSPSRDPPGQAAVRNSTSHRFRPKMNPAIRRDSRGRRSRLPASTPHLVLYPKKKLFCCLYLRAFVLFFRFITILSLDLGPLFRVLGIGESSGETGRQSIRICQVAGPRSVAQEKGYDVGWSPP